MDELQFAVQQIKPDVIVLTETWLHGEIGDAEISIEGFNIFRCDRETHRGGGVVFYVATVLGCQVDAEFR